MSMTLDEAVGAFHHNHEPITARLLIETANEYCNDGMIDEATRDAYVTEAQTVIDRETRKMQYAAVNDRD